jgi:hypothetical protein
MMIIDPCINPDGRDRCKLVQFHCGLRTDPAGCENTVNPGREGQSLQFDLNRDWAWQSGGIQQRMKLHQQWMPHVHVDYHEQGINGPYYFAPGGTIS